jgi:glycosyltransferase involved in cell wall biosynthesis
MASLVSTIIPTFDRKKDAVIAVRSALAQTYAAHEVIVVDDGSRDGTAQHLRAEHGDRVTILRTKRLGVSGARNHGMAIAKGEYIALLDSDDEWAPEKLSLQVAFLEAHPDHAMVLTDVLQMDRDRRTYDVLRRRVAIPENGDVLRHVLRQPALAPSSALFRRRVIDDVGGFDASLPTAEDIDFHLRVALRFRIGVIEEPLTRYMRGHDGLSAQARTYADYMFVMERFLLDHRHVISAEERQAALREASLRNMRGMLVMGQLGPALRLGAELVARARTATDLSALARMTPAILRSAARNVLQ